MKTLAFLSGSLVNSLFKFIRLGELEADYFNMMLLVPFHVFLRFLILNVALKSSENEKITLPHEFTFVFIWYFIGAI